MLVRANMNKTPRQIGGFTYLGVLFAVALIGMSLAMAGTVWSVSAKRDREKQLLWVGDQFRTAIGRYYNNGMMGAHAYPRSLEELLEDRRGPVLQRHLRRLYLDPMTGHADWQLIRTTDGSILGVSSSATGVPIKQARFDAADEFFEQAKCYCDWRFVYLPQLTGVAANTEVK
jgi:type II secretory pathway pseudopilin PulG